MRHASGELEGGTLSALFSNRFRTKDGCTLDGLTGQTVASSRRVSGRRRHLIDMFSTPGYISQSHSIELPLPRDLQGLPSTLGRYRVVRRAPCPGCRFYRLRR